MLFIGCKVYLTCLEMQYKTLCFDEQPADFEQDVQNVGFRGANVTKPGYQHANNTTLFPG